ncbi:MAG: rhodanese-like domain-containing protein, partial [Gammaproteobacteria bacterium]|nr:rhodanese-like domain-containing protein [Gammaproteobacteria bacterium]
AGFADLMVDLSDTSQEIEFAMPSVEQFCSVMGALGVGDDSRVILYDANFTAWAARVWWMLRWAGFDNAAILNGGLTAWTSAKYPLSTEQVVRVEKILTPRLRPELISDRDEVFSAIGSDNILLVDTMPGEMYRGEMSMYARPGHISGAINIDGLKLLDKTGCFLPDDELEAMHHYDHQARVITYCGGGIMASSSAFIMTRLGFSNVSVYTASLQEWAADPGNPMNEQ